MTETAYFLPLGDERLFAFLHRPDGPCHGGAVLCAPLAEEQLWSHRVFVNFARELCVRGYAVLRFDYRGEGDSDRQFEQSDLQTRVADASTAIEELTRQVPELKKVTLVGLRLGGAIAALAAAGRADVERLVLWDPVINGADYMQSVLRSNLMFQMAQFRKVVEGREALVERLDRGETINVEGYELSAPMFRQISAIQLEEVLAANPIACQIVSIAPRAAPARDDLVALGARCRHVSLACAVEEPFWREIKLFYQRAADLFRVTFEWLGTAT
jgi:exosortase A-associated hydrolase 2